MACIFIIFLSYFKFFIKLFWWYLHCLPRPPITSHPHYPLNLLMLFSPNTKTKKHNEKQRNQNNTSKLKEITISTKTTKMLMLCLPTSLDLVACTGAWLIHTQCHSLWEGWFSLPQHLSIANIFLFYSEVGLYPHFSFSNRWFYLV